MGHSLSWLAVQDTEPSRTLERLGLEASDEAAEPGDAPLVGCGLPGGWYVIAARGCDHALISDPILRMASAGGTAVACSIEEHVMSSSAAAWGDGRERWRVSHAGDADVRSLTVTGETPPELAGIRDTSAAKQDAERPGDPLCVDWHFEIPLLLARAVVGFKHDEAPPAGAERGFVALRPIEGGPLASAGRRRPWWRFW